MSKYCIHVNPPLSVQLGLLRATTPQPVIPQSVLLHTHSYRDEYTTDWFLSAACMRRFESLCFFRAVTHRSRFYTINWKWDGRKLMFQKFTFKNNSPIFFWICLKNSWVSLTLWPKTEQISKGSVIIKNDPYIHCWHTERILINIQLFLCVTFKGLNRRFRLAQNKICIFGRQQIMRISAVYISMPSHE